MKQYNKYVRKWQDLSISLNEAMQKDDFEKADKLMEESKEAYETYKKCCGYPTSNKKMTFGELNYMFESNLPLLFKKNKKALKECTNFIKNDQNLLSQFKFIDSLRKYNCDSNAISYVNESIDLASKGINRKKLRESVNAFADLLAKYEIGGCNLDEDVKSYYKNCETVLCESKKLTNLTKYTNCVNEIASYIENHKPSINEEKNDIVSMTESLKGKIANLSEEEKSLVNDIIDYKSPTAEGKQEKIYNHFKNECIETINTLLKENNTSTDNESLNKIKEQIEGKTFCKESIVQDVAKLLEIIDILKQ